MATRRISALAGLWCLGLLVLAGQAGGATEESATEESIDCVSCHQDSPVSSPAHSDLPCTDCHEGITKVPPPGKPHAEKVVTEDCDACHLREAKKIAKSVHVKNTPCQSCHGEAHKVTDPESLDSPLAPANQIHTCGKCHEKVMDGYLSSSHAKALLVSGLVSAPACTNCHGDHSMRPSDDEKSATSHDEIPNTCGSCHAGILRTWMAQDVHGRAWQELSEEGPVCTTCHAAHAIHDPTAREVRLGFPAECGNCHGERYRCYRGSFHGQATSLGFEASAICSDCHTPHGILLAGDPRSSLNPKNIGKTCGRCHPDTQKAFTSFDPHPDPTDPEKNPTVYYIWVFMTILTLGVFGVFGLHDALWLQRSVVGALRGELKSRPTGKGTHVRRFPREHIWTHVVVVSTFLLLAATGLPLKFHDAVWAQHLVDVFGGLEVARVIHRIAAVLTFGYAFYHLWEILLKTFRKGARGLYWGPDSLVPQPNDGVELLQNLRYFLYLGPKPSIGRWGYWEKFDYMAVFWGIPVIGLSGLMVWFPDLVTSYLPGWTLNAAYIVHSDEALLATGFIFVFHFFHTHLRPESFPLDPVIFTGRMPLERFQEERPQEYAQLVASNQLESRLVDPPTQGELRTACIFGYIALTIGVLLAIGIFWALIGQMLR
jgi:thiosulfate reductase cytochrome b subunit